MAVNLNGSAPENADFKEAVCVDVGRVYDSCCDRDCLEDLRCFFRPDVQELVNEATNVKLRSAEVLKVYIDVEPVNFNNGFFACDLTFFFLLDFELYSTPHTCPKTVKGLTVFNKRVILFGSDGNAKIFTSTMNDDDCESSGRAIQTSNMPKCVVQVVDPIVLSTRRGEIRDCYEDVCCIPKCICDCLGGDVATKSNNGDPAVYVTLGLFSIIRLVRNVQMLVPVYDFCIPEKQCEDSTDQPCDTFRRIEFPTDDFFPPRPNNIPNTGCCGCCDNEE